MTYWEEYLSVFEPLFEAAFNKSEFNLVMSLLGIRSASDVGWDPFENSIEVMKQIGKIGVGFEEPLRFNLLLWQYAHMIEESELYELVANLLRTLKDEDYIIANHKNKHFVNLKVNEKITRLEKVATGTKFTNIIEPFKKSFDSNFRNSINHADYAIKSGADGGVTMIGDKGFPKIYSHQEAMDLVNRALALHNTLTALRRAYIARYTEPTVIMSSATFGGGKPVEATAIVRKNHGVIGFRANASYTDGDGSPIEMLWYTCLPYEQRMIKEDKKNLLPASRAEATNKILKYLPLRLRVYLVPKITSYQNRRYK